MTIKQTIATDQLEIVAKSPLFKSYHFRKCTLNSVFLETLCPGKKRDDHVWIASDQMFAQCRRDVVSRKIKKGGDGHVWNASVIKCLLNED